MSFKNACSDSETDGQTVDVQSGDVEPVVYHRKTLTSSVPVRDICRAIKQYGFVTSPYPIIISTEIHCVPEQQNRLAAILKEVFGDMLVSTPLIEEFSDLPSPEDLKGKILFKVRTGLFNRWIWMTGRLIISRPNLPNPSQIHQNSKTTSSIKNHLRPLIPILVSFVLLAAFQYNPRLNARISSPPGFQNFLSIRTV